MYTRPREILQAVPGVEAADAKKGSGEVKETPEVADVAQVLMRSVPVAPASASASASIAVAAAPDERPVSKLAE